MSANLSSDELRLAQLISSLRKALRGKRLGAAYVAVMPDARPACFVCYLVEPVDPQRLIEQMEEHARRIVEPEDFAVVIGPTEDTGTVYRLFPLPPSRLGE